MSTTPSVTLVKDAAHHFKRDEAFHDRYIDIVGRDKTLWQRIRIIVALHALAAVTGRRRPTLTAQQTLEQTIRRRAERETTRRMEPSA